MIEQARSGMEKLESLTTDASILDPLREALAAAAQPSAEPEEEIAEINADEVTEPADFEIEVETSNVAEIEVSPIEASPIEASPIDVSPDLDGYGDTGETAA